MTQIFLPDLPDQPTISCLFSSLKYWDINLKLKIPLYGKKQNIFIMWKCQTLPQLILCIFCVEFLQNLDLIPLYLVVRWYLLQFWHQLEPCHSVFGWLSSHWLGSWGNLPYQGLADSYHCSWGQGSFGDCRKILPSCLWWVSTHQHDRTELSMKEMSCKWTTWSEDHSVGHPGLA